MPEAASRSNLSLAFGLEPEKAVEHLQSKGLKVTAGWRSVDEAAHARAFTVANVTKLDVLKDIQDELLRAQRDGLTMQQFRDNLVPALTRKGWFAGKGEPVHVPDGTPPDPVTGELATQKRLTARRLQTIFQTNMQSSMMAGRYRELIANVDRRPWFQYVAILDGKTRPAHRAMHGRVFRFDDPGWKIWWPPCGWNCRCRVRALSDEDMAERELVAESSVGRLEESRVPLPDGSISTTTRYRPANGGPTFAPDPGFNGNPAMFQAADRLAVQRAPQALPSGQAQEALHRLFTHPTRKAELETFARAAVEAGPLASARVGVGALDDAAVLRLADEGIQFDQASPIAIAAARIAQTSSPLSPETWATVPDAIAFGSTSWDAPRGALVYLHQLRADQVLRVSVRAGRYGNEVFAVDQRAAGEVPAGLLVRSAIERRAPP